MTGKDYERKGLRRLERKYKNHTTYMFLMRRTTEYPQTVKEILIKRGFTADYTNWLEEYLDLKEIVAGFTK